MNLVSRAREIARTWAADEKERAAMDYVRKIANSDIFDHIIDLPENLRHKKVEIIILPYLEAEDGAAISYGSDFKNKPGKNHNPKSNHPEEPAWVESAREYYENR